VPAFHRGLGAVALGAAAVLLVASMARRHRPVELLVQLAVLGLVAVRAARLARTARSRSTSPPGLEPDA
jgi:hypothetical protein